ncbi:MAG: hypothetical protein ACR2KV_15185 [Solirubrobacteraceae bacterium]
MRFRLVLLAVAVIGVPGVTAAAAGSPAIHTALPCYLPQQAVRMYGSGFHAGDRYSVALDHTPIGTGTVRAGGAVSGRLSSGSVAAGAHRVLHRIQVTDGSLLARVGFHTSAFDATFSPSTGDPRTLRVRYTVDAIGLSSPAGAAVYLHYVDPAGRPRLNAGIGRTSGVCGSLHSIRHRLFPLEVTAGTWRLQFDLDRSYSAAAQPRIVRQVAVG